VPAVSGIVEIDKRHTIFVDKNIVWI